MRILKVLNKGQVVIPAEIRLRYDIQPGNRIEIRDAGDHLELYRLPSDPIKAFQGSLKREVSLADSLIAEHASEVKCDEQC